MTDTTTPVNIHVLAVLDGSGSMYAQVGDVRGGYNAYIDKLREDANGTYTVSLVIFDGTAREIYTDMPLSEVPALDAKTYFAGGSTALYDALGDGMRKLTKRIGTAQKKYGDDRVLVIVTTDGAENASTRYGRDKVHRMITRRTEAGNWTFVYLGANQDAWANASTLGFHAGNVANYQAQNTRGLWTNIGVSTTTYSSTSATTGQTAVQDFTSYADFSGSAHLNGTATVVPVLATSAPTDATVAEDDND